MTPSTGRKINLFTILVEIIAQCSTVIVLVAEMCISEHLVIIFLHRVFGSAQYKNHKFNIFVDWQKERHNVNTMKMKEGTNGCAATQKKRQMLATKNNAAHVPRKPTALF